ncbi:MAG: hypothetical protein OQJ83_03635 [Altibacter sp.]|nr:hypothetical protein [Altibacter sp.]
MKRILLLSFLTTLIISCHSNSNFNKSGKFYKGIDNGKELFLTFINDTVAALNSDSLKTCGWNFMNFESINRGLFKTNELKTDTVWFIAKEKDIEMILTNENLIFEKIELPKSEIVKIQKDIEISQNFADKGILFDCEYSIKDIGYFYERAVEKVKNRLKNPSSAKFNEAYIHKHKTFNEDDEYLKSTTTVVSLDVEAKNGFGNFTESKYYVFFIPREDDESKYDIEFSDSPVLDYELRKKIKFE